MIRVTDLHTASAFNLLRIMPELESAVVHIRALHADTLAQMADVPDEASWRKLQGRAQALKEVLDLVDSSGELVSKLSRPRQ